jgi:hypothetical protein
MSGVGGTGGIGSGGMGGGGGTVIGGGGGGVGMGNSPVENVELLYEYFPLSLDDWYVFLLVLNSFSLQTPTPPWKWKCNWFDGRLLAWEF